MASSLRLLLVPLLLCAFAPVAVLADSPKDQLTVKTSSGIYTGLIDNALFPNVRQFRSIPYAQPPLGKRRWLPPVAVTPSARRSFATRFPPSCPQYQSQNFTVWTTNITDFAIRLYGQSFTAGAMAQASSEDCLYLAIWTPVKANVSAPEDRKLPVALFLPGGDFVGGGVDVPYQQPAPWVERTRSHIVVTANYRLNIGGFPWAAGLETQNLGILDARMALEWVYANIASFGGDPSRISLGPVRRRRRRRHGRPCFSGRATRRLALYAIRHRHGQHLPAGPDPFQFHLRRQEPRLRFSL